MIFAIVCWSFGFAAMGVALAATLSAGDLIKASGAAVYYYGDDGKRYVFPTESTYMSWYGDFSAVKTITDAELAAIAIGGNATVRPGTKLVKINTDPKTYAVSTGGVLRHVDSEARAITLYGDGWNQRIIDIPESFWVNYSTGDAVSSDVHPDGALVKYADASTVYLVEGGLKRAITGDAFTANRFKDADIVTIETSVSYSDGSGMVAKEDSANVDGGASAVVTGGDLTVALSSATPASQNVIVNIDNVVFSKFTFTAGETDMKANSVRISRSGLGATADFTSVTLYEGSTKLGSTRTSWASDGTINYNISGGWTIPAGTSKELTVVGKLGTSGTYNALGILEVAVASGSVSGTFPAYGNQMSGVSVTVGGVTITGQGTVATKKIGTTDVELASFKLANTGSVEDSEFKSITLKNKGTAADKDLSNLKLYKGSELLVADPVQMSSDKIVFVLDEPYAIDKSKNETFKVLGDIVDGDANTVEFILDATTDLEVVGKTYNTNLTVSEATYDEAGEGSIITIDGAELNIAFSSVAVDTIDDMTDVEFGTLTLSSGSTDIKITNMIFTIDETEGNATAADTKDVDEFEIVDQADGSAYVGTMTGGGDTDANDETWTFDDEIYLTAGETRTFTLRGDLPTGIGDNDSYKVTMSINTTNMTAETVPAGDSVSNFSIGTITGKLVTVKAPYITIKATEMNAEYAVVNDTNVVFYKGTIEATAGVVTISRMKFEGGHETAGTVTYTEANLDSTNWSDFSLYIDGVAAQTVTNSSMTTGYADFNSIDFTVQPGNANKVEFEVKGTVASVLDDTNKTVHAQLDTVTAKDADNDDATVQDSAGTAIATGTELETTRTVTLTDKGILYVSLRNADTGYNKDRIALAGNSYWVAKVRVRAQYEDIKIKDLKFTNYTAGVEDSIESICLYSAESTDSSYLIGCTDLDTSDIAFFDDINYVVEQGTEDLYVYVTTRAMSNVGTATADTSDDIRLAIATTSAAHITATGVDSNEDLIIGNTNAAVAAGEIVFDKGLNGTFDEVADSGGTASSTSFMVAGSKIGAVALVSSYGGETVDTIISGTGEYTLAILKLTTENHSNTDADGNDLKMGISNFVFDVTKFASTTFSAATIERIGGSNGVESLVITDCDGDTDTEGDWTLLTATTTLVTDGYIEAGDTAYFVVKGTISALLATTGVVDWVRVSLDSLNSGTNNVDWMDGYDTDYAEANDFDYLRLDTTSITGTKVAENL